MTLKSYRGFGRQGDDTRSDGRRRAEDLGKCRADTGPETLAARRCPKDSRKGGGFLSSLPFNGSVGLEGNAVVGLSFVNPVTRIRRGLRESAVTETVMA
jgi:hypothetical protein